MQGGAYFFCLVAEGNLMMRVKTNKRLHSFFEPYDVFLRMQDFLFVLFSLSRQSLFQFYFSLNIDGLHGIERACG